MMRAQATETRHPCRFLSQPLARQLSRQAWRLPPEIRNQELISASRRAVGPIAALSSSQGYSQTVRDQDRSRECKISALEGIPLVKGFKEDGSEAGAATITVTYAFCDRLAAFIKDLRAWSGSLGTLEEIAVGDSRLAGPGEDGHKVCELEVAGVRWSDAVVAPCSREGPCCRADMAQQLRYLALCAMERRHFRPVTDGWYKDESNSRSAGGACKTCGGVAGYQVLSDATHPQFSRTDFLDVGFLQAACNLVAGGGVDCDGHWREDTQRAYSAIMACAGLRPAMGISDDAEVYRELLVKIAVSGFAAKPIGCD